MDVGEWDEGGVGDGGDGVGGGGDDGLPRSSVSPIPKSSMTGFLEMWRRLIVWRVLADMWFECKNGWSA
jgi:hypothetical protein